MENNQSPLLPFQSASLSSRDTAAQPEGASAPAPPPPPPAAAGSAAGSPASNQGGSEAPHAPPAAAAHQDPKAPWDMDEWSQPAAPVAPAARAAYQHDSLFDDPAPEGAGSAAHSPNEAEAPVTDAANNDFFGETSPTTGEPPNEPPAKPDAAQDPSVMDAINRQIAKRTADIDAATKEKETKILAAAKAYLEAQKTKREKEVSTAKATHQKEQQDDAKKIDTYKKSGAVWNSVGMLVDLQKPNPHSKNTERMRSLLNKLNEQKVKA